MTRKAAPKPKLTDAQHGKRFAEMAREVGASNDPKAFEKVASAKKQPKKEAANWGGH
jgi:hypothetical protein